MKKTKTALLLCFITSFIHAQLRPVMLQVSNDTLKNWSYYFGDEFNGNSVNEDKWYKGYSWGGLSYLEMEYAAPENLKFNNGVLEMHACKTNELRSFPDWMIDTVAMKKYNRKFEDGKKLRLQYTTSAIWSKKQFKYGYFECRCKVPEGKGLWPAFWLYGGNPNDELDFMEMKGERKNEVHVDVHCPDNCDKGYPGFMGIKKNWGGWVKCSEDLTNKWVIISGVWMPGYVSFFVNGDPVAYFKGDFKNSMNLIANLAVAVDNGPFNPGPDSKTVFPAKFEVDYIRLWKPEGDSSFNSMGLRSIAEPDLTPKEGQNHSKGFLKKPIRFMFDKKKLKAENGFISFYPYENKKYMINLNGKTIGEVKVKITDAGQKTVKEQSVKENFSVLDLSTLPSGVYKMSIETGKNKYETNLSL